MMETRRSAERIALTEMFDVVERNESKIIGLLADISETGLMFATPESFDKGALIPIRIRIPGRDHVDVAIDVEVCWSRPGHKTAPGRVDCRIVPDSRAAFAGLVRAARKQDSVAEDPRAPANARIH